MKFVNSTRVKLVLALFGILLFWQSSKLWSMYTLKPLEVKELIEKQSGNQQILVTVYYEALCPDSRNFIIQQLVPTFNSIEDYIELQMIPYGKAETIVTNDDYEFKCQHGPIECEANIIHGCAVNKITRDSRKQLELIACMIKYNMHPMRDLANCGSGIAEYLSITECAQTLEGRRLLSKYGQITSELRPKISFIPTITLDNDIDNQILVLKNLKRQICLRLENPPRECGSR